MSAAKCDFRNLAFLIFKYTKLCCSCLDEFCLVPNWSDTYMVASRFELLAFGEASVRRALRSAMIKMWRRIIAKVFR